MLNLRLSNWDRSEEHTSELQSRQYLVCRLLLEEKKFQCDDRGFGATELQHLVESPHLAQLTVEQRGHRRCHDVLAGLDLGSFFFLWMRRPPRSTLFPYATLVR